MANSRAFAGFIAEFRLDFRTLLLDRALPGMVIVAGILCQFCDATVAPAEIAFVKMHTLFGLLLCCAVIVRCNGRYRRSSGRAAPDIGHFYRHQKRLVYLLLYGLAAVKQVISTVKYIRHGGATAPGGSSSSGSAMTGAAALPSFDDFQIYVVYGVLAILLVGICAQVWDSRRAVISNRAMRERCSTTPPHRHADPLHSMHKLPVPNQGHQVP